LRYRFINDSRYKISNSNYRVLTQEKVYRTVCHACMTMASSVDL